MKVAALAALALCGCSFGQRRQRPVVAPVAEHAASGTRLRVTEVVTDGQPTSFVVGAVVSSRAALREARLGSSSAAPCAGAGSAAAAVELDGQRRPERPLALGPGERSLRLAFPSQPMLGPRPMAGGGFLDVQLEQDGQVHCLRTPLAGPVVPQGWRGDGDWSAGWNLWFFPTFQLGGSLGRWTGPVRFGTDVGLSTQPCAGCTRGAGYLLLPVSLTAESYLTHAMGPGIGLKLAYDFVPGFAAALHRRDGVFLHGPRLEAKLAVSLPDGGLAHGPREIVTYFSGFVARWGPGDPRDGENIVGFAVGWDAGL